MGYDLYADGYYTVPGMTVAVIETGIAIKPPPGTFVRIEGRSSLARDAWTFPIAGIVDPDFRGQIRVVLLNFGRDELHIEPGRRVAQFVLVRCETPPIELVHLLPVTRRGDGGFGSSGH